MKEKQFYIILITLFFLFAFAGEVKANVSVHTIYDVAHENIETGLRTPNKSYSWKTTDVTNKNGNPYIKDESHTTNHSYTTKKYSMTVNGKIYYLYCLDANLNSVTRNAYYPEYQLFYHENLESQAYDAGMLEILSKGYHRDNTSYSGISGNDFYYATMIALRAYSVGFWNKGENTFTGSYPEYAIIAGNYGAYWAANAPTGIVADSIGHLSNRTNGGIKLYNRYLNSGVPTRPGTNFYFAEDYKENIIDTAKYLFYSGIVAAEEHAAKYGQNVTPEKSGTISDPVMHESKITLNNEGFKEITRTYTMNATDFSNGKITSFNIEKDLSSEMNITSQIYKIDGSEVPSLINVDLSTNPKIEIILKIEALKTEDCSNFNYKINYEYSSENTTESAGGGGYIRDNGTQKLYFYDADVSSGGSETSSTEKSINANINLCPISCDIEASFKNDCQNLDEDLHSIGYIKEETNIVNCVINNLDEAGNSYVATGCEFTDGNILIPDENSSAELLNNNPYCSISCKEDYTDIRYPGKQIVQAGRYFTIGAEISGTKSCYTDVIDKDLYEENIQDILDSIRPLEEIKAEIELETKKLNACSTWEIDFKQTPEIKYSYNSGYIDLLKGTDDEYLNLSSQELDSPNVLYCTGELKSDEYNECASSTTPNVSTKNYNYNGSTISVSVNQAKYYKYSTSKIMSFSTPKVFYTIVGSGDITYGKPADTESIQIDGLPLKIEVPTGLYNFEFFIDGLGSYYGDDNNCELGRLIDSDTTKDSVDETLSPTVFKADYLCEYEHPYIPTEECVDCETGGTLNICPNCIVTIGGLYFRVYSSNNFEPNPNRDLGYNWSYNYQTNDIYGFVANKAAITLGYDHRYEITNDFGILIEGEEIYAETPVLRVNLTPEVANYVRNYNNSESSYTNNTLECYDYTENGVVYENVFCYSEFLDDLQEDNSTFVEFDSRPLDNREKSSSGYFETFTEGIPAIGPTSVGGPSWK